MNDTFTFILRDEHGRIVDTMALGAPDAPPFSGTFVVSEGLNDTGKEYTFTVTEKKGTLPYWYYDQHTAVFKVRVVYEDSAEPFAVVTWKGDTNTFYNERRFVPAMAQIDVKKVINNLLEGREIPPVEDFVFQLMTNQPNQPRKLAGYASVTGEGTATFNITYSDQGEYLYQLSEVNGSKPGWEYSTDIQNVAVSVEPDQDQPGQYRVTIAS